MYFPIYLFYAVKCLCNKLFYRDGTFFCLRYKVRSRDSKIHLNHFWSADEVILIFFEMFNQRVCIGFMYVISKMFSCDLGSQYIIRMKVYLVKVVKII